MLTDRISNMQGEEPSVRKRGHAGWMLASCVAISVVLCYGQISNSKAATENVYTFVNLIKDYSLITELNSAILHTLIEKIVVHEAKVIDGEKAQKIEIYYKFVGRI